MTSSPPILPSTFQTTIRIHELDGLRGILALFVVCFHLAGPLTTLRAAMAVWTPFLMEAWYAVDVFFVMSGFVMMYVYGGIFPKDMTRQSFLSFMRARIARLYPVHIVALLVMLVGMLPFLFKSPELAAVDGRYSWSAFLASLLMLHSPWIDHRTWNYPAWSISAEWHAYLIFPFLVPLLRKFAISGAAFIIFLSVVIPFVVYRQGFLPDQYPTNGLIVLVRAFPLFLGGMALYLLQSKVWKMPRSLVIFATFGTLFCLCIPQATPFSVLL